MSIQIGIRSSVFVFMRRLFLRSTKGLFALRKSATIIGGEKSATINLYLNYDEPILKFIVRYPNIFIIDLFAVVRHIFWPVTRLSFVTGITLTSTPVSIKNFKFVL